MKDKLKIVIISDTHEKHEQVEVPDGDLLIHCGDWTNRGEINKMGDFFKWFGKQKPKRKICIAGNHELLLDGANKEKVRSFVEEKCEEENIDYLFNSSIMIDEYKIYGSPWTPRFFNWSFNRDRGKDIAAEWAKIPDDVNILITHGPCYGVLDLIEDNIYNRGRDLHQGCADLRARISELKYLRLHAAGHLHATINHKLIEIDGVKFVNASICDELYNPIQKPLVVYL